MTSPRYLHALAFTALATAACASGSADLVAAGSTSGSGTVGASSSGGAGTSSSTGGEGGSGGGKASTGGAGGGCSGDCSQLAAACQTATWNPSSCACDVAPMPNGTPCFDGDGCTLGDSCLGGACKKGTGTLAPDACQTGIGSINGMPPGATTIDFDQCLGGCDCCAGSTYADPITSACITCSLDATLAAKGITKTGGEGTAFVDCITGNADAPIGRAAMFIGASYQPTPDNYAVELVFSQGLTVFGFSALPSASSSTPKVRLDGYTSGGILVGTDSFTYTTAGGDCATSNPAARFFGFRACCGTISRVVATFTDANTVIDSISYF